MTATVSAAGVLDAGPASSCDETWLRIGQEHYEAGRIDEAIAAYQLGLAAAEAAAGRQCAGRDHR